MLTQIVQEDITAHQASLDGLSSLARSITANCSPDDCPTIETKLKQCSSGYEDLVRSANARKRVLDDGLVQATNFATDWSEAMAAITAKHSELEQLSPVGVDIDTVKTQLEEYKVSRRLVHQAGPFFVRRPLPTPPVLVGSR